MISVVQVAAWTRGADAKAVTRETLRAGCDAVEAVLRPVLPQHDVLDVDDAAEVEQEVEKLQGELLQHGMAWEQYPIDLRQLAAFLMCADALYCCHCPSALVQKPATHAVVTPLLFGRSCWFPTAARAHPAH
jgi:hypothetical protein